MEAEEWRPVVTHPGRYEVSSLGRVRAVARVVRAGRGRRPIAATILATTTGGRTGDYLRCMLMAPRRHAYVHHLVAEAFHGPRPSPAHVVCHLDDTRENNRAANLRWGTAEENDADRWLIAWLAAHPDAEEAPF